MPDYHFQTRDFAISNEGIHLLRNGFNYKTYKLSDIDNLNIERGKEVKNWIVLLVVGVILILFAVWYSLAMLQIFADDNVHVIYIEEIIVPVLPLLIGFFFIYASLRKGTILKIKTIDHKSDFWPLKDVEKSGQIDSLKSFLETRRR